VETARRRWLEKRKSLISMAKSKITVTCVMCVCVHDGQSTVIIFRNRYVMSVGIPLLHGCTVMYDVVFEKMWSKVVKRHTLVRL